MRDAIARLSTAATRSPTPARQTEQPVPAAAHAAPSSAPCSSPRAVDVETTSSAQAGERERPDRPEDDEPDVERRAAHVVRRPGQQVEAGAEQPAGRLDGRRPAGAAGTGRRRRCESVADRRGSASRLGRRRRASARRSGRSAPARAGSARRERVDRARRSRLGARAASRPPASSSPSRPTSTFPPDSDDRDPLARRGSGSGRRAPRPAPRRPPARAPASAARARSASRPGSSDRRAGRCRRGSAGTSPASRRRRTARPARRRRCRGWIGTTSSRSRRERHRVRTAPARRRRRGPLGRRSLRAAATPEISPPPPTPTTTTSTSGRSSISSRPDRAVAGDDRRVVERVARTSRPSASRIRSSSASGLADVRAVQDDPRAVAQAGVDLRADGAGRHDDRDRHAGRAAGPGIRLPGVAGRQRDDAARRRLGRQGRDPVGHPARLERAGLLEVLGLQVEPVVGEPRRRSRRSSRPRPSPTTAAAVRWTSPSIRSRAASTRRAGR